MARYSYDVVIWLDGERFTAVAPHYPGVVGVGDTIEEAVESIREAFVGVIEVDGHPLTKRWPAQYPDGVWDSQMFRRSVVVDVTTLSTEGQR